MQLQSQVRLFSFSESSCSAQQSKYTEEECSHATVKYKKTMFFLAECGALVAVGSSSSTTTTSSSSSYCCCCC